MKTCPECQRTYPDDTAFCLHDGARLAGPVTEADAQLAAGLPGRFRLVRRLGKGGTGTVFLAEQIGVGNRPVALKILNRELLHYPNFLLHFQNEMGSTGRIHHANVVTIHEAVQADDGTPYLVMEFLDGESLHEVLKRRGALAVTEVAEILQQAARGLNAAHELGITHNDLNPDNIFLTRGDEGELIVKVVVFSVPNLISISIFRNPDFDPVLNTPAYLSYDQIYGMKLDARSDIYSLGVVVYEMLTGRVPFQSDTPFGYLEKHSKEEPPPFRAVAPGLGVPAAVERAVLKALAKDRDQRYASVLDFAHELSCASQAPLRPTKIVLPGAPLGNQPHVPAKVALPPKQPPLKSMPEVKINPKDGLTYVWIPPGTFMMGDWSARQVTITKGFWLGQTKVTVGAYKRFTGAIGLPMPPEPVFEERLLNSGWRDEAQAIGVTWEEAQAYCRWAGGRLPTEAEWEYAARAGGGQVDYTVVLNQRLEQRASAFGLYDMMSTLWEWVNDWFDEEYYRNIPSPDPAGPPSGTERVARGGFYPNETRIEHNPGYMTNRKGSNPARRDHSHGFRCAREVFPP